MINVNDILELKIIDLDYKGDGVSKYGDFYIYTSGAITDEEVIVKIRKVKKNIAFAELIEVKKQSINRVNEYSILGSLNLFHLSFSKQLEWQKDITYKTLTKALKQEINIYDTITDNKELYYRNKVVYHVFESEYLCLGLYKRNSLDLIRVDDFELAIPLVNEIVKKINEKKIRIDSKKLKNIIFKNNSNFECLVTFVSTNKSFKGLNELLELLKTIKEIKGITINIKNDSNKILGEESYLLYGDESIKENNLIITDKSFMQVNFGVMNLTYQKIKEHLQGKKIIDAYSGIGSISYSILNKEYEITMIENNNENIKLAEEIKNEFHYQNIEIVNANAEDVISEYNADTIIVDPPRAGLYETLINEVIKKKIKRMIYLSCDLGTLTRDLRLLSSDYKINAVYPIRMFPQTNSFETLVILDYKETENEDEER